MLTAIGVLIGTSAGFWQLGRAAEKRVLEAQFAGGSTAPALDRLITDAEAATRRYGALRLAGRYDPAHQVLLDNMSYGGQPGYQVLTPFRTPAGTVLVNRGWVAASGDRRVLPDVGVGADPREIIGRIERFPRPGIRLAAASVGAGDPWPRRLLFPTAGEVSAQLGTPLRDYQLLLDPAVPDGYLRDWHPGGMVAERHLAYAVQWFGLALTVIVIHLVLALRRKSKLIP
jgi:surfeit locus 1 family protein